MIRAALVVLTAVAVMQPHAAPGRLGVSATEFHLTLSRGSVKAGRVIVQLQNAGQDVHDLRLRRIGGKRTYSLPVTTPGGRSTLTLRLLPGRYRLWCSLANHAQLGMRAVLRVRR
ncbi:MAG TPA: hypothetical protein VIW19_03345 [Gaiellaceae bacterium]